MAQDSRGSSQVFSKTSSEVQDHSAQKLYPSIGTEDDPANSTNQPITHGTEMKKAANLRTLNPFRSHPARTTKDDFTTFCGVFGFFCLLLKLKAGNLDEKQRDRRDTTVTSIGDRRVGYVTACM
jgi:hypothetical protein